jgi:hypothetical protein
MKLLIAASALLLAFSSQAIAQDIQVHHGKLDAAVKNSISKDVTVRHSTSSGSGPVGMAMGFDRITATSTVGAPPIDRTVTGAIRDSSSAGGGVGWSEWDLRSGR